MELASYRAFGALNFDMATRFLKIVRPSGWRHLFSLTDRTLQNSKDN